MNQLFGDVNAFCLAARKDFLLDLPLQVRNNLRGADLALINVAINSILEGNSTINGGPPIKRTQLFIVIASYFETAKNPQNASLKDLLNIRNKCIVQIKYKDKTHTYDFSANCKETIKP